MENKEVLKELTVRKDLVLIDLVALPESMTIDDFILYGQRGYIFYDSNLKPDPQFRVLNKEVKYVLFDVSTEEGKKIYEKIKAELDGTK